MGRTGGGAHRAIRDGRERAGAGGAADAGWHENGNAAGVALRPTNVALLAVSVLAAAGCRPSAEQRADRRATTEAEEKASEATITSAVLASAEQPLARSVDARRDQQLAYRARLQDALDALDARRADEKRRGPAHLRALDARRDVLKHDLDALDRTNDQDWVVLKARIDRDLREHSNDERRGG